MLDRRLFGIRNIDIQMQSHFNCKSNRLPRKKKAFTRSPATGFSNGHQAQGLNCGQDVTIWLLAQQAQCLSKEMIPRSIGVVRICSSTGLAGESTANSQKSIDQ